MIVLNPSKVKQNFQEKLDIYKNMNNFGSLECPCCHSKEYIRVVRKLRICYNYIAEYR